ncbi:MAG TPA: hypothetical protein VFB52_07990 [Solirubrobacterales bacterium]|nr:hypothetical protein [Solirubrobacterales bacterium]
MKAKLRLPKLTYSNVIASLALFVALSGVAVAAGLPKNSVGPNQIKRGAVNTVKLKNRAVTSAKLANKAVTAGKLGPNSVTPGNIGNGAITSAKIGNSAVIAASIKNGVVTTNKLANEAVNSAKLGKGSVTLAKLASDVAPLLGTLKSGQTLRGIFYIVGNTSENELLGDSISYQFPISGNPPAVNVLKKGATNANCSGIGSGSAPAATAGNLCVYLTEEENLADTEGLTAQNNQRLGFGLAAKAKANGKVIAAGQWAVTAP